ncbi:MAG: hypothetical protein H6Q89_2038 [Myxococcaceae bacterium]|nr:hypothetical protein [Myxococcaceae bacterium]
MLNRSILAVCVVALSGCQPWKVVREADANPLAGKTSVGLQWLEWSGVWVDGVPEEAWASSHDDWMKDWAANKSVGASSFRKGLSDRLAGGTLSLLTKPDPTGSALLLRPTVVELTTGGWKPTSLKISVLVLDGKGTPLEEISTVAKSKNDGSFEGRLAEAAALAGQNVASYLQQRSKN